MAVPTARNGALNPIWIRIMKPKRKAMPTGVLSILRIIASPAKNADPRVLRGRRNDAQYRQHAGGHSLPFGLHDPDPDWIQRPIPGGRDGHPLSPALRYRRRSQSHARLD